MDDAITIHRTDDAALTRQSRTHLSLRDEARILRGEILEALFHAGGGHYGGCLSVIDILLALYRLELQVSPQQLRDPLRDRLILSKGHAALALYAVLRRLGLISGSLNEYADFTSSLEGHPDMTSLAAVDFSSGSLGQGLSVGLGMAYALRRVRRRVWVVLGDGECQEGQVWEAAMLAAACNLDNLCAIVDSNRFQEWGREPAADAPPALPVTALVEKWRAFGWFAIECDGHDFRELEAAFKGARRTQGQPCVIIAHTVKGKGVPMMEAQPRRFHCDTVSEAEHRSILCGLSSNETR